MNKTRYLARTVDRETVRKILAVGHEFDVNKGGYFDARSGCVNIWAGPEDKPTSWDAEIIQGALDYPRSYCGGLGWDWVYDEDANLYLDCQPFDLLEKKGEPDWDNLFEWLTVKAHFLLRMATIQETVLGTKCPLCDFVLPSDRLLNELLDHISEHGVVTSLCLGSPTTVTVSVNGGVCETYPLRDATDLEK